MKNIYAFTSDQILGLFKGYEELKHEYIGLHGYLTGNAMFQAANDILEGLDAEKELFEIGEINHLKTQLIDLSHDLLDCLKEAVATCKSSGMIHEAYERWEKVIEKVEAKAWLDERFPEK